MEACTLSVNISAQKFLIDEGLEKPGWEEKVDDCKAIQCFADHFCRALKKSDAAEVDKFLAVADQLLSQEKLSHILQMHFITSMFPLLSNGNSIQSLKSRLSPHLLKIFNYYLILENNWL